MKCNTTQKSSISPLSRLFMIGAAMVTPKLVRAGAEERANEVLAKMEHDALKLRDEMEIAYSSRCSIETLASCSRANNYDCAAMFPTQTCMDPDEAIVRPCRGKNVDASGCNALWDKNSTKVSVPRALADGFNGNPTDPELIETVCYSRNIEPYLTNKFGEDEEYWGQFGAKPSWSYFGAHNGIFRKIPGDHAQQCGLYDPRRRPWYVAASSGPKDVVIVVDVSGSMDDYNRLDLAKNAAKTIVETLTVADRVAVVAFNDVAQLLTIQGNTKGLLVRATQQNKNNLLVAIDGLNAGSATNFYAAFEQTFNSIEQTIQNESTSGCNIAILFLTDGQITAGDGPDSVISLVNDRTGKIQEYYRRSTYIFTYSLGLSADIGVPKRIACETGGIWTQVEDQAFGGDLISAMSSYYKLFALGLGEGDNNDFVAIVEPYNDFSTGKMMTTVSAPVFDRSVTPHTFVGVVGIDSYMDALEQVLGEDASSSSMLNRFIALSTARCPRLNLNECELDALRFLGGGDEAMCGACNSSSIVEIVPQKCRGVSDLPRNVWANDELLGKTFEERACCKLGETEISDSCPALEEKDGLFDFIDPEDEDFANEVTDEGNFFKPKEKESTNSSSRILIIKFVPAAVVLVLISLLCVFKKMKRGTKHATSAAVAGTNYATPIPLAVPVPVPMEARLEQGRGAASAPPAKFSTESVF